MEKLLYTKVALYQVLYTLKLISKKLKSTSIK